MKISYSFRTTSFRATLFALALAPALNFSAAQAQPDINNGAKADNPANRPVGVPMTIEQRIKARLRIQLQAMGVVNLATQDKLLAYIETENTSRTAILEKAAQLQLGLRGNALSDAQVAALLNDYQASIEEDKVRRAKAEEDLKKEFDLPKNPKIEAMLVLLGVYGDGPTLGGGGMAAMMTRGGGGGIDGGGRNNGNAAPRANTNPFLGGGGNTQRQRNNRNGGVTQPNIRPNVNTNVLGGAPV